MKEHPILFSTPMVRAIMAGTKTQTRRIVKLNAPANWEAGQCHILDTGPTCWNVGGRAIQCPYGRMGDRLWVRETWAPNFRAPLGASDRTPYVLYKANGDGEPGQKWRPSIFMRRHSCRIVLEIESVRVERLHAITEQDSVAEGLSPEFSTGTYAIHAEIGSYEITENHVHGIPKVGDVDRPFGKISSVIHKPSRQLSTARDAFRGIWWTINGQDSWFANPWVWVITFRRVQP